ncbi:MAG: DNA-binding protein [Flavobacteriales bacterium]|nr:MAG: DNA-binding protein [Flavobacteriales bacterium]
MAIFSENEQAQRLKVKSKILLCSVCGHDHFYQRKAQLNTRAATLFNIDWANKSAHCYVCADCSHIEWFLEEQ